MDFTLVEYCNMLLIYGKFEQNARLATREYNRRYPECRAINKNVFLNLIHRMRETGSVIPNRRRDAVIECRVRIV